MTLPNRPDSSFPLWKRGEAATPWEEAESGIHETTADSGAGPSEPTGGDAQQQRAPGRERRLPGSRSGLRPDDEAGEAPQRSEAWWDEQPPADAASLDEDRPPRQLHPLPRGLVELYGLLAVLFVLVPEWMAGGALFGFQEGRQGSELPAPSGAWKRLPELRLASLSLAELRQLAHESGLIGYGRQNRQELTARLLRRLKARP